MKIKFITFMCFFAVIVIAQPDIKKQADFSIPIQTKIEVYQLDGVSFLWTLRNATTNIDGTALYPVFYFFDSQTCVTGLCSWTSQTTGIFRASLTTNNLLKSGRFTFGVGVSNSVRGVTIAQQGVFQIIDNPQPR